MSKPAAPKTAYNIRGPNTWAIIREQYLAGRTAQSLAEQYGPAESTIRGRATREGWTKRCHADATPPPDTEWLLDPGSRLRDAPRAAAEQARVLLAAGQFVRATEAAKLAIQLTQLVKALGDEEADAAPSVTPEAMEALRRRVTAMCRDG